MSESYQGLDEFMKRKEIIYIQWYYFNSHFDAYSISIYWWVFVLIVPNFFFFGTVLFSNGFILTIDFTNQICLKQNGPKQLQ